MFEVYVHVPFCLRRCGYCDFNTYTAVDMGGGASRANYANMAIREMHLIRRWQVDHGIDEPAASSVFFGGGTPTVLAARDLAAMLDAVRQLWGVESGAEVTTEANPDTVDAAYIRDLAAAGFTRISFGMQSAVTHVLRTLDRTHTPANVRAGVEAANLAGLHSSVDLIYGTPGETLDDWRRSLREAIDLQVNHISAYALTIEPTTKMGRQIAAGALARPDDDDEAGKYELADRMLSDAGLGWYEISNWARPGYESRHNVGYWRDVDWAGIGPGAHSHYNAARSLTTDAIDALRLRAWDITHPRLWGQSVAQGKVPWQGEEVIDGREHFEETVMLGMRLREGLDLDRVAASGQAPSETIVADLERDGLVRRHGTRLVATLRGRLLNDTVIQKLLSDAA